MDTSRYFYLLLLFNLMFFSCSKKNDNDPSKALEIYHLKPNDIIVRKDYKEGDGWYAIERFDFFALKNFNINDEEEKKQLDSFVVKYLKQDSFLSNNKNSLWVLHFYEYGNGITESTKHEYNTDYTIHNLFNLDKIIVTYFFRNAPQYSDSLYYGTYYTKEELRTQRKAIIKHFEEKEKNYPFKK